MFTPNEQSAGLVVKLPGNNSRALQSSGFYEVSDVTSYEVVLVNSSGKRLSKKENAGKSEIRFERLEIGEYDVSAIAWTLSNSHEVIVADCIPQKVLIEDGKESTVDLTLGFKPHIAGIKINGKNIDEVDFSCQSSEKTFQIENIAISPNSEYLSLEDVAFEVRTPSVASISSTGLITCKNAGSTGIAVSRKEDGALLGVFTFTVYPNYSIKYVLDGTELEDLKVDGVDLLKKVVKYIPDSWSMESVDLSGISAALSTQTGKDIDGWYYDGAFTEKVVEDDFSDKYEGDGTNHEITLYARSVGTITTVDELKNAVLAGGAYKINNESLILTEAIVVEKDFTLVFEGTGNEIGRLAGFKETMFTVKSSGSVKFVPSSSSDMLKFNGAVSGGSTGQILRLEDSAAAEFENTTFFGNAVECDWAHPSAIAVTNTSKLKLKNCNIEGNSITGSESRAPGIKVEANTTLEIDGATFKSNTCSSYPFGLDIWVEDMSASVTLKGIITSVDRNVSLHIKESSSTAKPIDWQLDATNSSDFSVTFGTSGEGVCNIQAFPDVAIFVKDGGLATADTNKIHLLDNSTGELNESTTFIIDSAGKVVVKQ